MAYMNRGVIFLILFIIFFLTWNFLFASFSNLVALARTSSITPNISDGCGHICCLVTDLRKKSHSFSPLSMIFAVDYSCIILL